MRIEFNETYITVYREAGDKAFYGIKNAAGESKLLYAIKQKLNSMGFDLIKKRMWKDGHLFNEMQQYLRTRKPTGDPNKDVMIYNGMWNIRGAEEDYNRGCCRLALVRDCFEIETTK